jgi:hypothetical protein
MTDVSTVDIASTVKRKPARVAGFFMTRIFPG